MFDPIVTEDQKTFPIMYLIPKTYNKAPIKFLIAASKY